MSRRAQIVEAAGKLLENHGPDALSVRAVAAEAGIGASTLRHYFPTQRELFEAVIGLRLDQQLSDKRIDDPSVAPALRLYECLLQFLPEDDNIDAQMQQWFWSLAAAIDPAKPKGLRSTWEALVRQGHVRMRGWLAVLADEGVLRSTDLDGAARLLAAVVDGIAVGFVTPGEQQLTYAQAEGILHDAIDGVIRTG